MTYCLQRRATVLLLGALGFACGAGDPPAGDDEPSITRLDGSGIAIAELESRVPPLLEAATVPGLQVAVIQDRDIVYLGNFGVRDTTTGEPVLTATNFAGLSFSKTIFAYLVMRLVDQGVIDLDRPLHEYLDQPLPEYDFYADLEGDPRWRRLTARMCLSHTTGWPNWRWLTDAGKLAFLYEPGARFSYSGEGFAYLQLAVETTTGRNLEALAQEEIFRPLGMKHSSFLWHEGYETGFAADHDHYGKPLARERWEEAGAAGSVQTTAEDYARFLIAVMDGRGLSAVSHQAMLSPQVPIEHLGMFGPRATVATEQYRERALGWGLGWGLVGSPHGQAHFHTGNDRGSANYNVSFPGPGTAVVLLGNSQRLESIAPALVELIVGDRVSPFDYLGYERYDSPRREWVRRLVDAGFQAGMDYLGSLSEEQVVTAGIDSEAAFAWAGEELLGFERFGTAGNFFTAMNQRYPDSPAAPIGLARVAIADDEPGRAADLFARAIELSPAGEHTADLEWLRDWAAALAKPVGVDPATLARYAGTYGPRQVSLREGTLWYLRTGGDAEPRRLIALSEDTFVMADLDFFRLRFEGQAEAAAARVIGLYQGGDQDENERDD